MAESPCSAINRACMTKSSSVSSTLAPTRRFSAAAAATMARTSVDLPAPLAPTTARRSVWPNSLEKSSKMSRPSGAVAQRPSIVRIVRFLFSPDFVVDAFESFSSPRAKEPRPAALPALTSSMRVSTRVIRSVDFVCRAFAPRCSHAISVRSLTRCDCEAEALSANLLAFPFMYAATRDCSADSPRSSIAEASASDSCSRRCS
mmetsp:Transcript_15012/g.50362  ORF Transcript_15012/g.50362 Transcript_15012/m.50362 type:complete len:203 (+) Transcript_15012:920-1528(+)